MFILSSKYLVFFFFNFLIFTLQTWCRFIFSDHFLRSVMWRLCDNRLHTTGTGPCLHNEKIIRDREVTVLLVQLQAFPFALHLHFWQSPFFSQLLTFCHWLWNHTDRNYIPMSFFLLVAKERCPETYVIMLTYHFAKPVIVV